MNLNTNSNFASVRLAAAKKPAEKAETPKEEPPKEEAPQETVKISYFPQDPGMVILNDAKDAAVPLPQQVGELPAEGLEDGPTGPRLRVSEPRNFPTARKGEEGFIFTQDDPRSDAANTYYVAAKTLEMAENYAGREIPWSFSQELDRDQMLIHPHVGGPMANAFYTSEGGSINFFHYKTADGHVRRTAQETDVVAHETGHAILDAMRPTYIQSLDVPAGGFHESFGDMLAMLKALDEESVILALKHETKGDLSGSNVVSRVAETLGFHAYKTPALRDAVNEHKFTDQHFLPYVDRKAGGSGFGTEAHAYANLFTGAFYDLFEGVYDQLAADPGRSFQNSVGKARDTVGKLLFRATDFSPVGNPAYPEVALAFIQADQLDNEGALTPLIEKVFVKRGILKPGDAQKFIESQQNLPKLSLRKSALESEESADKFLADKREKLGLPADVEFKFVKNFTTDKGETFMVWESKRDAFLDDPDFGMHEGSKYRGVGGLVLAFDADNKLMAANHDVVTDREMNDIKDHLRTAIQAGYMVTSRSNEAHEHSHECGDHGCGQGEATKQLHVQIVNDGSGPVLTKAPVVYC